MVDRTWCGFPLIHPFSLKSDSRRFPEEIGSLLPAVCFWNIHQELKEDLFRVQHHKGLRFTPSFAINNHQPQVEQSTAGRKSHLGPRWSKKVHVSCWRSRKVMWPSHCPVWNRFAQGSLTVRASLRLVPGLGRVLPPTRHRGALSRKPCGSFAKLLENSRRLRQGSGCPRSFVSSIHIHQAPAMY